MRLIDADALKKVFENIHDNDCKTLIEMVFFDGVIAILDTQPTINEWIPCSERLPSREEYQECNGLFIVSDGNRTYSTYFDIYDSLRFGEPTIEKFRIDKCVIAWMALPEPYKGGVNNAKTKKE